MAPFLHSQQVMRSRNEACLIEEEENRGECNRELGAFWEAGWVGVWGGD